jgi:hypothetical protein
LDQESGLLLVQYVYLSVIAILVEKGWAADLVALEGDIENDFEGDFGPGAVTVR